MLGAQIFEKSDTIEESVQKAIVLCPCMIFPLPLYHFQVSRHMHTYMAACMHTCTHTHTHGIRSVDEGEKKPRSCQKVLITQAKPNLKLLKL